MDLPDEILCNYEASGITFLRAYLGAAVTQYMYTLKERDREGERLTAVILEVEGEMIGGYGVLPSWTPGVFHLDEQQRLITEQLIRE